MTLFRSVLFSAILTRLNSSTPAPDVSQAPATEEADPEVITTLIMETELDSEAPANTKYTSVEKEPNTIAGIPVLHIALIGGGLLLAVAALIGMHFTSRRHEVDADYDEEGVPNT